MTTSFSRCRDSPRALTPTESISSVSIFSHRLHFVLKWQWHSCTYTESAAAKKKIMQNQEIFIHRDRRVSVRAHKLYQVAMHDPKPCQRRPWTSSKAGLLQKKNTTFSEKHETALALYPHSFAFITAEALNTFHIGISHAKRRYSSLFSFLKTFAASTFLFRRVLRQFRHHFVPMRSAALCCDVLLGHTIIVISLALTLDFSLVVNSPSENSVWRKSNDVDIEE